MLGVLQHISLLLVARQKLYSLALCRHTSCCMFPYTCPTLQHIHACKPTITALAYNGLVILGDVILLLLTHCFTTLTPCVLLCARLLDRFGASCAALSMNRDLGFGPAIYGLGSGGSTWNPVAIAPLKLWGYVHCLYHGNYSHVAVPRRTHTHVQFSACRHFTVDDTAAVHACLAASMQTGTLWVVFSVRGLGLPKHRVS